MEGRHPSNCQSTSTLAENIFGAAFLVVSKYLPVTQLLATCLPSSSELKYLRLPAFEIERHVAIEVQFGARKRADGIIGWRFWAAIAKQGASVELMTPHVIEYARFAPPLAFWWCNATRSTDWFNCSGGKEAEDRIEREEKARSISFLWASIGSAVWSRLGHCWAWSWLPGSSSKTLLTSTKDRSYFWNRSLDCLEDAWPILSSRVQLLLWTVSQLTRPRRTKDFWQALPLLQACFG